MRERRVDGNQTNLNENLQIKKENIKKRGCCAPHVEDFSPGW